jgi:hypothetical protein
MARLHALLCLVLAAGLLALQPAPALAAESPGVYDVQLDRTMYPASGSMTVTWRFVAPAGTTAAADATCSILIGGVEKSATTCRSGEAFSYDVGAVGYTTDAVVNVQAVAFDIMLAYPYDGSASTAFDGVAPNAAVTKFIAADGFDAPDPMPPATVYRAVTHANDNTTVNQAQCSLERVSPPPAGFLQNVLCPSVLNPGAENYFTTPSTSGEYAYVLVVSDPAGNTTRATRNFTVDATPPAIDLTTGPADGSASNAAHPAWSWTSDDPDATFTCALHAVGDSGTPVACTSPYTAAGTLVDGTDYALDLTAADLLGNAATTTTTFTHDVTAPSMAVAGGPADGATVTSTQVSYTFFAVEPVSYQCWWGSPGDTVSYAPCASGQAVTLPGNGSYALAFRAVDAAGNLSAPVLRTVTVAVPAPDRTAPRLTVIKKPKSRIRLAKRHRKVAVTVKVAVNETCTVLYRLDNGPWRTGATSLKVKVGKGRHRLSIYAVDRAANRSLPVQVSWRVLRAR